MQKINPWGWAFLLSALIIAAPYGFAKDQAADTDQEKIGEEVSAMIENIDTVQKAVHTQTSNIKLPSVAYKPAKTVRAPKYNYNPTDIPDVPVVYPVEEENSEAEKAAAAKVVQPPKSKQ